MARLYACIAGGDDEAALLSVAEKFAHSIELQDGAVLFDVSGLQNTIGDPSQIARKIFRELQGNNLRGNVAVAFNASTAMLYARSRAGITVVPGNIPEPLPLETLGLDPDTLNILRTLGIRNTDDLRRIPENELVARYGPEFRKVVDLVNESGKYVLTPNLKNETVTWSYGLDFPIADAERLIFILGRGLGRVFGQATQLGLSTERIDIAFGLDNRSRKHYELKIPIPSMDKAWWLKLINLRVSNDPPEAEIGSISIVCHFARPRTIQRGLYSAAKPEPESLLLTVGKIKKLVSEENVGVPVLLNQRLPKAFTLDPDKLPTGKESKQIVEPEPVLSFNYFDPPLGAQVTVRNGILVFLQTQSFRGRVVECGGVWKESSQWWNGSFWEAYVWDVELENQSIYRLLKQGDDWFVIGEYD
jgi:protein ImuB